MEECAEVFPLLPPLPKEERHSNPTCPPPEHFTRCAPPSSPGPPPDRTAPHPPRTSRSQACLLAFCRRADASDGGELLTDEVLTLLADESWTFLDLHGARSVTDEGVLAAVRACPALQVVDVGACPALTKRGVAAVLRNCPLLASLRVGGCPAT